MNRIFATLFITLIVITSCKKDENTPAPTDTNTIITDTPFSDRTWTIKTFDSLFIPLKLEDKGKPVQVYLEDYPWEYLKYKVFNDTDYNDPLRKKLLLITKDAPPSKHDIKVVIPYDYDPQKLTIETLHLNILPFTHEECQDKFFYFISDHEKKVKQEQDLYIIEILDPSGARPMKIIKREHKLFFNEIPIAHWTNNPNIPEPSRWTYSSGDEFIELNIDCDSKKITIPKQNVIDRLGKSHVVQGEGLINYDKERYSFSYSSDGESFAFEGLLHLQ